MELWLDSCDIEAIIRFNKFGIIQGITTNPSILAKSAQDPIKTINDLLGIQDGPIAVQTVAETSEEMVQEARHLQEISERIIVKIPCTQEGLVAIKRLASENIATIATALFHPNQAFLAALAGANYIAPYLGRMFDEGIDAWSVLEAILNIYRKQSFKTKILAAALKSTEHVTLCAEMGVHAITLKKECLNELLQENPLTEQWVNIFSDEWSKVERQFPQHKHFARCDA